MIKKYIKKLADIHTFNLNVGSGVEDIIDKNIGTQLDEYGKYNAVYDYTKISEKNIKRVLNVTLNADESRNESEIDNDIFSGEKDIKFDDKVGYYFGLYAGYVNESFFRENGSSGGFVSWLGVQLLKDGLIDGFIHVKKSKSTYPIFEYGISRTIKEIQEGAKSRYYPVELSKVLKEVKDKQGNYAIVGTPEIITEVRLLSGQDDVINNCIKYYIGLVCGHHKSTKYAEAIAWEYGIKPGYLKNIDFRLKNSEGGAIDYNYQLTGVVEGKSKTITVKQSDPFVSNWAHGFFKLNFSDYTDNAFNENADVTFGDAWLDKYSDDTKGTNIIIVRNKEIDDIIKAAFKKNKLNLDIVDVDTIKSSQSGLIHHVRDELPYRLYKHKKAYDFVPKKRVLVSNTLSPHRKAVQDVREDIAKRSHAVYKKAVEKGDYEYFRKKMQKYVDKYNGLYAHCDQVTVIGNIKYHTKMMARAVKSLLYEVASSMINLPKKILEKNADGVILSLTGYGNYGNVIQRYALQRFLKKHGLKYISYADPFNSPQSVYSVPKKTLVKTPLRAVKRVLRSQKPYWYVPSIGELHHDVYRNVNIINFVNKYIWQKPFNPDDKDHYRNYIVGSDQVWRNWYAVGDEKEMVGYYFLDFLGNKNTNRVAYAASFGKDKLDSVLSKEFIDYIKPFVKKFNAISVREKSGINIIRKVWGRSDTVEVVDPTLLLDVSDYTNIIDSSQIVNDKTKPIFYYILDMSDEKFDLINKVSKYKRQPYSGIFPDGEEVLPKIESWLKGFRDSEMVITDSFHGTVFSIINHTPFIVIGNENRGLSRITDLLDSLGLSERLVLECEINKFDHSKLIDIDWCRVQLLLDNRRRFSSEWLINNLKF